MFLAASCIFGGIASRLPESAVSDPAELSQSSSLAGAVLTSRRRSQSIVHDIFFASCRSGIRLGPFLSEVALLERACALHGLEFRESPPLLELRKMLLQHLLHGECVVSDARFKHRDYTACREVAAGFGTPSDLVEFILDELTSISCWIGLSTMYRGVNVHSMRPNLVSLVLISAMSCAPRMLMAMISGLIVQ